MERQFVKLISRNGKNKITKSKYIMKSKKLVLRAFRQEREMIVHIEIKFYLEKFYLIIHKLCFKKEFEIEKI